MECFLESEKNDTGDIVDQLLALLGSKNKFMSEDNPQQPPHPNKTSIFVEPFVLPDSAKEEVYTTRYQSVMLVYRSGEVEYSENFFDTAEEKWQKKRFKLHSKISRL